MQRLNEYVEQCSHRKEELKKFITFLDNQGFGNAPASTSHHLCKQGGLLEHTLNVCSMILKIREAIAPDVSRESCIITAIAHDCHKVCDPFGVTTYVPNFIKSKTKKKLPDHLNQEVYGNADLVISEKKPFKKNNLGVKILDGYQSLIITNRFIQLSPDEMQAIACHDGQYEYANRGIAQKEYPLTLLLHYADMWSARVIEGMSGVYEVPDSED